MVKSTAVVTGATSGIGRAFAEKFAEQGYDLLITGRREKLIKKFGDELEKKYGIKTTVVIADFSNHVQFSELLVAIDGLDFIGALVNNVGFGNQKNFLEDSFENQERMLKVHINSMASLTHTALKKMGRGSYIINVSSMAAFTPAGFNHFYSASKAFVNSFSESLYVSLKGKGIRVQALCPGFTRTDFHNKLGMEDEKLVNRGLIRWMKPEEVVKKSLRAMERGKVVYIPGFLNQILYIILRFIPKRIYYKMAEKFSI